MDKPENTLIQDRTADTLAHVSKAIAALTDHLGLLSESETPASDEAFLGMCMHAGMIKEAIDFEAKRCPAGCPTCATSTELEGETE
tara:strand:- start:84066 stop:84323 length:258 start_codon:yes stop_codon:yes gene_type:complete